MEKKDNSEDIKFRKQSKTSEKNLYYPQKAKRKHYRTLEIRIKQCEKEIPGK